MPRMRGSKRIIVLGLIFGLFTYLGLFKWLPYGSQDNSKPEVQLELPKLDQQDKDFKPEYVPSGTHPQVNLKLALTRGDKPLWNNEEGVEVLYWARPRFDELITNYDRKDVQQLLNFMRNLSNAVPESYHFRKMADFLDIEATLNPNLVKGVKDWMSAFEGAKLNWLPMYEIIHQLEVLVTKDDPPAPWTLKCNGCFKNEYKTLLDPKKACAGDNGIDIVVVVTTVPKAIANRMAVRETWGQWTRENRSNFRLIFLFGAGWSEEENAIIGAESKIYGDILQEDYHDSYFNLAQKVISGYKWILRNKCSRAKFLIRSADDTFVNLPEILDLLEDYGEHPMFQKYQVGNCYIGYKPYRYPHFKGYLSTDDYGLDIFPPYALGTSFLTSMALTKKIVHASRNLTYIPIEDSYLGLVLREIGSGCLDVKPFPAAGNGVSNFAKYLKYNNYVNPRPPPNN